MVILPYIKIRNKGDSECNYVKWGWGGGHWEAEYRRRDILYITIADCWNQMEKYTATINTRI